MVLRIILGIFPRLARVSSRMLEDGSRMPQDGLKDHPGNFSSRWREGAPRCSRMGRGCPRMVLRIILAIFPGCGASELQDARGWVEDTPGWS